MEIPKIKLVPKPETDEGKSVIGYKYNDVAGTRHFLGGKSEELNEEDYPRCEDCNKQMTFYSQIDPIGDQYDLADCMVIHTFICFDCLKVKSELNQLKA